MRWLIWIVMLVSAAPAAHGAGLLTERQARIVAAEFVRGPMFGPPGEKGPAAALSVAEIVGHIQESYLAVRGTSSYCGAIAAPTWIVIFDRASAAWFGGYPMLIDARGGKVRDCRS
jgi:hypothetical protein